MTSSMALVDGCIKIMARSMTANSKQALLMEKVPLQFRTAMCTPDPGKKTRNRVKEFRRSSMA
jgi:hypothetical protein